MYTLWRSGLHATSKLGKGRPDDEHDEVLSLNIGLSTWSTEPQNLKLNAEASPLEAVL